jgi:hypothetical protein
MACLPEARVRSSALWGLGLLGLLGLAAAGGPAWLGGLGLLGGGLWWWLGRRARSGPAPRRLRVLERIRLGEGAGAQLVEVDGLRLLVGTGPGGPRLLARLGEDGQTGGAEGGGAP